MALYRWLPDYAARHLSNLTGKEFVTSIPSHANREQRYSGQGGAFVRLGSASPQNDPQHANRDSPLQSPSSNPLGEVYIAEVATEHFIVTCPRCGSDKQAAGHWLYKPNKKCHLHCTSCHRYPSARQWQCSCKTAWFTCPEHRGLGFRCRGSDIVRDMPKHKRKTQPRDFWERSRKRHRRSSTCISGDAVT